MIGLAQALPEVGKSGISVFLDAGVIGLILTNSALLIKALLDRRTVKRAKEKEEALPCDLHDVRIKAIEGIGYTSRIATLEANSITNTKMLDDIRKENREDHGKIFEAISKLVVRS